MKNEASHRYNKLRYAILVCEEFSCLEFHMNRDMTNWILIKIEYRRSENGTITKTDTRKWH